MSKFIDGYERYRETFKQQMTKLTTDNPLNMETLADINYYKMIEKRGFRSWLKGVDITWEEIHKYVLRKMTEKYSSHWHVIQKKKLKEQLRNTE
jgi:hypothetical protein